MQCSRGFAVLPMGTGWWNSDHLCYDTCMLSCLLQRSISPTLTKSRGSGTSGTSHHRFLVDKGVLCYLPNLERWSGG